MSADLPPEWPVDWVPPKVSIGDMLRALRQETARIIVVQKNLVSQGARRRPDESQLKSALALYRAEVFLSSCTPYVQEIKSLIERLRIRGPR